MRKDKAPDALLRVRVTPRASREEIRQGENGIFRVRLTASPVEGKANQALVSLLAKRLGIARGRVEIVSGASSRLKTLRIQGLEPNEVLSRLQARN